MSLHSQEKLGTLLYVTWDGPSQWYLEALFFPIFRAIQERLGLATHVLQFSFAPTEQVLRTRAAAEVWGIGLTVIPTAPKLVRRAADAAIMSFKIRQTAARVQPLAIMGRSVLASWASSMTARALSVPLIFDADGLPHDERLEDAGGKPNLRYWTSRGMEQVALQRARAIIVRSERGKAILAARTGATVPLDRFFVAPNGRNVDVYAPLSAGVRRSIRARLGVANDACLVTYLGSLGRKYRPEWIAAFSTSFLANDSNRRLLILSGHREASRSLLASLPPALRPQANALVAPPEDVPGYLGASDLGLSFVRDTFASQAVSPIKVGEYLLCGCPVALTSGVGDLDAIAARSQGGVTLVRDPKEAGRASFKTREQDFGPSLDARRLGLHYFSEDQCVDAYCDAIASTVRLPGRNRSASS